MIVINFREFAERAATAHWELRVELLSDHSDAWEVPGVAPRLYYASCRLLLAAIAVAYPGLSSVQVESIYCEWLMGRGRAPDSTISAVVRRVAPGTPMPPAWVTSSRGANQ